MNGHPQLASIYAFDGHPITYNHYAQPSFLSLAFHDLNRMRTEGFLNRVEENEIEELVDEEIIIQLIQEG